MFTIRTTNAMFNAIRVRHFATFLVVAQKAVKPAAAKQATVKQLKAKLEKEKKRLAECKSKHSEKVKLLKEREKSRKVKASEESKKASEAEAKLIKKATRAYRNLSGLNVFVKEKCTATNPLSSVNAQWQKLTEEEKAVYVKKAEKLNEENRKVWVQGPKKPPTAYSLFVKKNWKDLGDFKKSSQAISASWKALSTEQKDAFKPEPSLFAAYKKAHEDWVAQRVKLYKEKVASS